MVRSCAIVSLVLLFGTAAVHSQTLPPTFAPRPDVPELISFFAPFVFPKIIQDDFRLKEYICSPEFAAFRGQYGDLYSVDAIFDEAMRLTWNNAYEALLISLVATMEHRRFGVRLPVFGPLLWVPLTSEFEDEFKSRVQSLPSKLYKDTPRSGDRDKLQHFFGSAFLTYISESREVAQRIGEFIEWGEDAVIVGGVLDERDFRANRQGQEFGLRLLDDKSTLPSPFFQFSIAEHNPTAPAQRSDVKEMENK
ncbi:MAG: hypothetical protein ABI623_07650 [bacterium]